MAEFVHLHLHSQYSLLDGAIHLKKLFPALKQKGMTSVALTDHGYMYGSLDFYLQAKKAGIKPIIGCETYVANGSMHEKSNRENFHLVLLAKNETGLKNLQYLVSMAAINGFYYNPRIDLDLLEKHSSGLTGLSACLGGELSRTFFKSGYEAAKSRALKYASIFEKGDFYLELQHNGIPAQFELNDALVKMSAETGIPLVATNDCHYLERDDWKAQEILMAISQGKRLDDKDRLHHEVNEFYLKTPEEMDNAFAHVPQAIENTIKIAEKCNVDIPNNVSRDISGEEKIYFLPDFDTPENFSQEQYLRKKAADGLKVRIQELRSVGNKIEDEKQYFERLEKELDIICAMNFAGYFLIVQDFINWAKDTGVPVGPGRGSGAGSIVAYSLRITELDPIRYDLLFERFLNPERVSMPDFDIDFCRSRRDEVLEYVKNKYGENNVAQISTYSTLKARVAIRDVGRVMGVPLPIVDRVAKLVPVTAKDIPEALEMEPRLGAEQDKDQQIKELIHYSIKLEGMYRHPGVHAAGVVLSDKPVWEVVPCTQGRQDTKGESGMVIHLVTQYDKVMVENAGLVKFDFLGLDNLTKINEALKRINADKPEEKPFDINLIPLDDRRIFEMLSLGETGGVFQMESDGFSRLLKGLKPDRFEDLIAAVALYRPGPLGGGMVDDFIQRKHGKIDIVYLHDDLSTILSETYGVIVYQEQVMQVARKLAGFSMGKADEMRRAMGKKDPAKMAAMEAEFVSGSENNGYEAEVGRNIWRLMVEFAGYGFNKSHSAAYALISYQTAYLRFHYPVEFMAGILSCERSKPDKVMKYLQVSRKMGIEVLPPDINESMEDFTIVTQGGKKVIRFGLGAIKGIGDAAVENIINARKDTPFTNIFDLTKRIDSRKVNKASLECLIRSGALDSVCQYEPDISRPSLLATVEFAIKYGTSQQKQKSSNQISLFDVFSEAEYKEEEPEISKSEPWTKQQMYAEEKEVLGIYLTGHPLEGYLSPKKNQKRMIREWNYTVGELQELEIRKNIEVGYRAFNSVKDVQTIGVLSSYNERRTRETKERYAQGEIDGMDGLISFFISSKNLEEYEKLLLSGEALLIKGNLEISGNSEEELKRSLRISSIEKMIDVRKKDILYIQINLDVLNPPEFFRDRTWKNRFEEMISKHSGKVGIIFHVYNNESWESLIKIKGTIAISSTILGMLDRFIGEENLVFLKSEPKLLAD
ncbi:DNA polymerase III subunit alpha [Myxococcota bacterium]|nr:DNA polymerase III subunit alpha [Myxococcota bacterium]MBU1380559.1 DNA polymerase III subunit alpha [Myxococcota bacterium]MBU1497891.1 DNA polymerase III subunit alpha [Myxococcota bacterium]